MQCTFNIMRVLAKITRVQKTISVSIHDTLANHSWRKRMKHKNVWWHVLFSFLESMFYGVMKFFNDRFSPRLYTSLVSPILATCAAHRNLPNDTVLATLCDPYKARSSALYNITYVIPVRSKCGTVLFAYKAL